MSDAQELPHERWPESRYLDGTFAWKDGTYTLLPLATLAPPSAPTEETAFRCFARLETPEIDPACASDNQVWQPTDCRTLS